VPHCHFWDDLSNHLTLFNSQLILRIQQQRLKIKSILTRARRRSRPGMGAWSRAVADLLKQCFCRQFTEFPGISSLPRLHNVFCGFFY
jgi:hypothetical protein